MTLSSKDRISDDMSLLLPSLRGSAIFLRKRCTRSELANPLFPSLNPSSPPLRCFEYGRVRKGAGRLTFSLFLAHDRRLLFFGALEFGACLLWWAIWELVRGLPSFALPGASYWEGRGFAMGMGLGPYVVLLLLERRLMLALCWMGFANMGASQEG